MRTDYIKTLLSYIAIGMILLLAGRVVLVGLFLDTDELQTYFNCWGLALWNMLRFDMQTLAYIAILPTLLFVAASYVHIPKVTTYARWYYAVLYTLMTTLTISDLAFYNNFGEHLNVTVFDFFNEGPLTLIQTFWEEYPVIWYVLILTALCFGLSRLRMSFNIGRRSYAALGLWIAFVAIALRGSVTEFPLQVEDINVSASKQLNDCVPNAAYSLKKAIKEKSIAFKPETEEAMLSAWGFTSLDEAWNTLGRPERTLYDKAEGFDAVSGNNKQPDVVLILSESWSGYLCQLAMQHTDADLLCGMRKHLSEDLLFLNYQSIHNGTIATIENLMLATSYPRVFMSKYRYNRFETSFAEPFLKSGYKAFFISGMEKGWENVGVGLESQGFATVFKYDLLQRHPEYKYNSVGIYDHHVMNSLMEYLQEPSDKPRLFIVMTTTNHPPFVYPDDIQLPGIPDTFYSHPAFANKRSVQEKYILGFQYANYSLGTFIDGVKKSSVGQNTIVMVTGDHNVRTALAYGKGHAEKKWEHAVPLYLYLPKHLRHTPDGSYACDTNKWGCHYDILPTLAPLTLKKGVPYLCIGQNLLSDSLNAQNTYSYNVESTLADKQCAFNAERRASARECLLRLHIQRLLFDKK